MNSPVKILPYYTYADYAQWEGQWELIDGIPYAMSPSPAPKHQRIANNLGTEFRLQLKQCAQCNAYQPVDYRISDDTILQPDMLVICGTVTKKYLDFPPSLVAEILSPATALKDRHTKYGIYESQGIPYFIIISTDTEDVEIYELQNGKYLLSGKGSAITHEFLFDDCRAVIDFKEIW
ncbi:MAG: Uma2 family endonuclease [Chitinophagaceae bacterium]|nr:Uma2 family endonuclease [Chitinophagaceae bacterium]